MHVTDVHPQAGSSARKLLRALLAYLGWGGILSLVVFFVGLDNYFTADDWWIIFHYGGYSWQTLPTVFQLDNSWYRPVFEVFVNLCRRLFGLNPLGYHLASLLIYAWIAGLVGFLMELVTRDRRIGFLSLLIFVLFAAHAEPVLWFSAANELLAALFVLLGVIGYVLGRQTHAPAGYLVAVVSSALAYATKETALFFPLVLIVYDLIAFATAARARRRVSFFLPLLPVLGVWLLYLWVRIPMGSPYLSAVTLSPLRLAMNLAYYLLVSVWLLPNNYAFFNALPLWRMSPLLPLAALAGSTTVYVILGIVWVRNQLFRRAAYWKSLLFTGGWTLAAWGPVLFIVSERATFASSIGIAATVAILFVGAWDAVGQDDARRKNLLVVTLIAYLGLNLAVLTYRSDLFTQSAELNQRVIDQLRYETQAFPPNTPVVMANLPTFVQHVATFTSAFPEAAWLLNLPIEVTVIHEHELTGKSPQAQAEYIRHKAQEVGAEVVYWYQDGELSHPAPPD